DGDGEAGELAVDDVALAGVHADADAEAERADGVANCAGAADGPRGAVEAGSEEPVAGGVNRLATEARELAADRCVVLFQERRPRAAQRGRLRGRLDEVGEENG